MDFMARQLRVMDLAWDRVPAHDMNSVDEAALSREVAIDGHRIGMGRGSQCCALTNFDVYRRILAEDLPAALILQDDVELSPDLGLFAGTLDWLPAGINLVQFEKYGRRASRRLLGPALGPTPVTGRSLHRLHSRTAGAACYLVTKAGAARILAEKPLLDVPIDHFLFSPNVSPLFDRLGVAVVRPALARQADEETFASDLSTERSRQLKGRSARLRRLWLEINRTPAQIAAMASGARWKDFAYERVL
jgi:glycosyl transferase family 25